MRPNNPVSLNSSKIRPFLKWPGGKFRIIDKILSFLPPGKKLIEPFVGSGAVFLNTNYDYYLLNDINPDLINLYTFLQVEGQEFIDFCKPYFNPKLNFAYKYYELRQVFNECKDLHERAAIFLYLNRHGYNGLCRYNKKLGYFNVPFGRYVQPYFPEKEMQAFFIKAKRAKFVCEDFSKTLQRARKGQVVYCDPPYVPLNKTSNFTQYQKTGFTVEQQIQLADMATELMQRDIAVVLSNHHTPFTKKIYNKADLHKFLVRRFISCNAQKRVEAMELLAIFEP